MTQYKSCGRQAAEPTACVKLLCRSSSENRCRRSSLELRSTADLTMVRVSSSLWPHATTPRCMMGAGLGLLNPLTHDVPKRERDMIKTCDDSEGTSVRDKQYEPCFTIETLRVSLSTRDKPWVYTDTSDTTLTGKLDSGLSVVCPPPLWECSDSVTPPVIDTRLRGN